MPPPRRVGARCRPGYGNPFPHSLYGAKSVPEQDANVGRPGHDALIFKDFQDPGESMSSGLIRIRGARTHNLKDLDLDIPRETLTVITGLSGSGKSSLAFDTIYAEGQRRYVESLSAYARQFLELMGKPDVDGIDGLSPAISIEQKTTSRNPRSTVGTVTEIHDYMRLLWARVGVPYSPVTGLPIEAQTVSQMVDRVLAMPEGTRLLLLAPVVRDRKGEYRKELADLQRRSKRLVLHPQHRKHPDSGIYRCRWLLSFHRHLRHSPTTLALPFLQPTIPQKTRSQPAHELCRPRSESLPLSDWLAQTPWQVTRPDDPLQDSQRAGAAHRSRVLQRRKSHLELHRWHLRKADRSQDGEEREVVEGLRKVLFAMIGLRRAYGQR